MRKVTNPWLLAEWEDAQGSCWFAGPALILGRVDDDDGIHELGEGFLAARLKPASSPSAGFVQFPPAHPSDAVPFADLRSYPAGSRGHVRP